MRFKHTPPWLPSSPVCAPAEWMRPLKEAPAPLHENADTASTSWTDYNTVKYRWRTLQLLPDSHHQPTLGGVHQSNQLPATTGLG